MSKVDIETLKRLQKYDSATIQNAAIRVRGYVDESEDYTGPELKCFNDGGSTIVGYAVTTEVQTLNLPEKILDWNEYYDELENSDFPLISILKDIDNPSGRGASFGDVMAYSLVSLGVSGVVIDGSLRDLEGIKEAKCPIWAKGRVPGHGPFNLVSLGKTIEVSGLKISHGDLLVCDKDGITNIPLNYAEKISRVCEDVRNDEFKSKEVFSSKDFDYESWKNQDKEY